MEIILFNVQARTLNQKLLDKLGVQTRCGQLEVHELGFCPKGLIIEDLYTKDRLLVPKGFDTQEN